MPTLQAYLYSDVAQGGAVSANYPAGFTPDSFDKTGAKVCLLSPDSAMPAGSYSLAWGASAVTVTNNNGIWKAGVSLFVSVPDVVNAQGEHVTAFIDPITGGSLFSDDVSAAIARLQKTTINVRPGTVVLPATTSTGAGGWNTTDCILSAGISGSGSFTRVTGSANPAVSYIRIRRKIPVALLDCCNGKIEIPFYIPPGLTGTGIQIIISSDSPAADPPNATPTNRQTWTIPNSQFRLGKVNVITIDPAAVLGTSQDIADATVWVPTGANDPYATKQLEIYFSTPAGVPDQWFEVGPIAFGGYATPNVMFMFDGAEADASHMRYVLPALAKYGFKAAFAARADGWTSQNITNLQRIYAAGHDIANEGLYHTSYGTTPANLIADAGVAQANFAAIGITRGPSVLFAAPQNSLKSGSVPAIPSAAALFPGVTDLIASGFKFIRYGLKCGFATSKLCGESAVLMGAASGDQATYAGLKPYLDAAELHGESVLFLFHSLTAPGGTAGSLQCKYEEFTALADDVAARIAQGRFINTAPTEFIASYERATGWKL